MILLDTHVVFWLNSAPEKLSRTAVRVIRREAALSGLGLSSISLWELALLIERRRLRLKDASPRHFLDAIVRTPGLRVLEISVDIAMLAARFPPTFPADPGDRIIAATAQAHDVPLVTRDHSLLESPVLRTIW